MKEKNKAKNILKEYATITVGMFIVSASVYYLMMPNSFVVGSISGLVMVLANFIPLKVSTMTMILNVALLIIGIVFVGKEFGGKTVITSLMLPVYLRIFAKDALPEGLTAETPTRKIAALVMNANPFTLGHQYLVEKAAAENDLLHLFIVSEDASLVPFKIRKQLVMKGTAHLKNICYHDSGPYIISNATFPSYFQKDENAVIESHAMLDLTVFTQIAKVLSITRRYVGEEPTSLVTGIYNRIMSEKLPEQGIECIVVPRKTCEDTPISASNVRLALQNGDYDTLSKLVPQTTLDYFKSPEAIPVIERIRQQENVIHY